MADLFLPLSLTSCERNALFIAELFFYIFLPPLLLDAAVRIDFFLFKKVWSQRRGFTCLQMTIYLVLYSHISCKFIGKESDLEHPLQKSVVPKEAPQNLGDLPALS